MVILLAMEKILQVCLMKIQQSIVILSNKILVEIVSIIQNKTLGVVEISGLVTGDITTNTRDNYTLFVRCHEYCFRRFRSRSELIISFKKRFENVYFISTRCLR